jgi:hypothetical protein
MGIREVQQGGRPLGAEAIARRPPSVPFAAGRADLDDLDCHVD